MDHQMPKDATVRFIRSMKSVFCVWALSMTTGAGGIVVDDALLGADPAGEHWAGHGRTFDEQRFSTLKEIHQHNIDRVSLAWSLDLPDVHSVTMVPLAADGVIYFAAGYSVIHAVDGHTGKLLWRYDPEVAKASASKMRMAWGSRGLALWKGRIYVGTQDGRLIAVDASTDELLWSVLTIEKDDPYRYITGAPRGMPAFPEFGTESLDALRHYIYSRAHAALGQRTGTDKHKATDTGAQRYP